MRDGHLLVGQGSIEYYRFFSYPWKSVASVVYNSGLVALRSRLALCLAATLTAIGVLRAEEASVFGRTDNSEAGLIGILYDLKQTQKRQPTGVKAGEYSGILNEFLAKDWSESVLNRYFRATRPLYATQIFMPLMDAGKAPKAFDMEKVIKPSAWVVVFKGQVSPPEDGTYRFVAYADDVIAAALNGKTVVIGGRADTVNHLKVWKAQPNGGPRVESANGLLAYGDWMTLKKDEPVDLDVLVGERPGGQFCAFLLYEKQGVEYPKNEKGVPQYPIFQLAPFQTPSSSPREAPPFSQANATWKGYQ